MKINNLKEIKNIFPVASAKPGNSVVRVYNSLRVHNNIVSEEYDERFIVELIKKVYDDNEKYIKDLFLNIYEKPVKFSDKLSDLFIKIKSIINMTGKSIDEIVSEIRSYLGYKCSFHRIQNGKLIPINSERILNAYKLVQEKKSLVVVENILYL
jgi:hypothetical protein